MVKYEALGARAASRDRIKRIKQNLERLNLTLEALFEDGFSQNIQKCKFIKKQIDYLGYIVESARLLWQTHTTAYFDIRTSPNDILR